MKKFKLFCWQVNRNKIVNLLEESLEGLPQAKGLFDCTKPFPQEYRMELWHIKLMQSMCKIICKMVARQWHLRKPQQDRQELRRLHGWKVWGFGPYKPEIKHQPFTLKKGLITRFPMSACTGPRLNSTMAPKCKAPTSKAPLFWARSRQRVPIMIIINHQC